MTVTALGRLLSGYLELFAECYSSRPILEHFGDTVAACCRPCRGSRSSRLRCSGGRRFERCSDSCELRFGTTSGCVIFITQRLAASPQLAKPAKLSEPLRGCAVSISEIGALLYQACDRKEGRTHGCGRGSSVWVCGLPRR